MEIMARAPKEMITYVNEVLPWVDHIEYTGEDEVSHYIIFMKKTPQHIKDLFKELEPKLENIALKR